MTDQIDTLLSEERRFEPPAELARHANAQPSIYARAENPERFWEEEAGKLAWMRRWHTILDWEPPHARWFVGGQLNASVSCLDRHANSDRYQRPAIVWEGEPGERRVLTYGGLTDDVCRFANALRRLGIRKGDRVAIYLPLIPEAAIAMLACARIGAVHSVVFGGFSAESLRDRINDAKAVALITADGGYRRGSVVPLKRLADEAVAQCPSIQHVIVVRRQPADSGDAPWCTLGDPREHWYRHLVERESNECEPERMDAEDMLFILYTSGTTGQPKGIVHTTGGYLTHVTATTRYVFDLKDRDVFWCSADIGWITGHSYLVYGPLANGATVMMYEGAPDYPDRERFWKLIARYGVTVFYTAPTAIRAFMKWGAELPARHDLTSLRILGSVGEPINPEAWMWYREAIGGSRCPIVDTWWQTETGGIMITPLPGVTTTKPGSATHPFPGISAELVDEQGKAVAEGGGYLTITKPWPGMLRTIYGDDQRYRDTYWSRFPGRYFAGDGAKIDSDGYWWVLGRVDDVLNVAGHRIGTMEVESALVDHAAVAEAAVVGRAHDIKGSAIAAFVTLRDGHEPSDELKEALRDHVTHKIGAIAKPEDVLFTADLPKTRSGKIMRRLLRDIAEGRALGDTTTLADPAVVAALQQRYEEAGEA